MTFQTLAFTIVLLLFSSFSFAQERKKSALTECACEYTFIYSDGNVTTFSKVLYDLLEVEDTSTQSSP